MHDAPRLYRDLVEAIAALALDLPADSLAAVVPATPQWSVRQLIAHLAGGPADAVADRMDGAPGPSWTTRHVAEREGRAVADLVEEMRANTDAVAASVEDNPRPAIVWDLAVHHADLHEALGRGVPPEWSWSPVVHALAPMLLSKVPAEVHCGDATYGAGGPDVTVDPYELFRVAFSRRSRAQVSRVFAGRVESALLDELPIFGPRDDDQPVPEAG
ncbi:maleylpyruvate isomerase N-terminal domain-containing protein [Nocardioides acrostichi]|uniref:Maleylpyruvate isomerase N-terminal domain-containing protein n=1 Tax=Nocardioides acrostichi TaxID=2784339 RepID=A0A930UVS8_9ACTN|nr:maleylpyruvate isomerase N-terminal domain-containing protein [Nocardioides acrostichi]MBF4161066.1 maleylpyruvate isomerase N-terminal domain-containing protein [Nocardioides acrostichi]